MRLGSHRDHPGACPCSDPSLCDALTSQPAREIFGFGASGDWRAFDWNTITTICWADDPQLVCTAHAHGARVIGAIPDGMPLSGDKAVRAAYINRTVSMVRAQHLDGVTFDYESPLAFNDPRREYYVALVRETTAAMHAAVPGSQVSVCVAWSPDDIDGRAYDNAGLAEASDLLYVMGYDTRSQVFGRCIAGANSPASRLARGLQRYIDIGVSPNKLVLGTPWYAYDYPCTGSNPPMHSDNSSYCPIPFVPFRGVNCSDAAGTEIPFSAAQSLLRSPVATTQRLFDASTATPFFNYRNAHDGTVHQVWFDDAESSAVKYHVAQQFGVRGVGPYRFDQLDYASAPAKPATDAMWAALRAFANGTA